MHTKTMKMDIVPTKVRTLWKRLMEDGLCLGKRVSAEA